MESGQQLISYSWSNEEESYLEFGEKEGNSTPAFSMKVIRMDRSGHFKIEMDMEIMDTEDRSHKCMFFVNAETTAIERLGRGLQAIAKDSGKECISLYGAE